MNIAIINTLAKSGSTGKIAFSYFKYLKSQGHTPYLFYGRHDEQVSSNDSEIIRIGNDIDLYLHTLLARVTGLQGVYSKMATRNMLKKFKELNIQAVCMFNLHGYYINYSLLFNYIGKNNLRCEYVMLDEYPFLGKCAYSFSCDKFMSECKACPHIKEYPKSLFVDSSNRMFKLKKNLYKIVPQCVFVGVEYTVDRAKKSAITKDCIFEVADEAIDLRDVYFPRNVKALKRELNIPESNTVIVTVTPYPNERKGGKYFLEAAKRLEHNKSISFVHVGYNADKDECPSNYIPIGYVKNQDLLSEYYSLGDLFVHTSIAETIPSAILEALACGTPILGFNSSGIPYSTDRFHGTFVEPCNVDKMVEVILNTPKKDEKMINSCRKYAISRYDSIDYCRKLFSYLDK